MTDGASSSRPREIDVGEIGVVARRGKQRHRRTRRAATKSSRRYGGSRRHDASAAAASGSAIRKSRRETPLEPENRRAMLLTSQAVQGHCDVQDVSHRLVVTGAYRHVRNPMYLACGHRRSGTAARAAGSPRVRRARGGRGGELRPAVRGADAPPSVRRGVRGVPARRAGVGAAATSLEGMSSGLRRRPRQTPLVLLPQVCREPEWRRGPTRLPTQPRCSAPPRRGSSSSSRRGSPRPSPRSVVPALAPSPSRTWSCSATPSGSWTRPSHRRGSPTRSGTGPGAAPDSLTRQRAHAGGRRAAHSLRGRPASPPIRARCFSTWTSRRPHRRRRQRTWTRCSPRLSPSRDRARHGPACCTPKLLARAPGHADAHVNLGLASRGGPVRRGATHYRAALAARPSDATAAYNLAVALGDQGPHGRGRRMVRDGAPLRSPPGGGALQSRLPPRAAGAAGARAPSLQRIPPDRRLSSPR